MPTSGSAVRQAVVPLTAPIPNAPTTMEAVLPWSLNLGNALQRLYRDIASRLETVFQVGEYADMPNAIGTRRFYYAADKNLLYYDVPDDAFQQPHVDNPDGLAAAWCPIGAPIYQGTLANKPAADGSGRFYYETDTNRFWIDVADPTPAWVELGVVLAPIIDHGALVGLGDDDHPFYARVTDFEPTTAVMSARWDDLTDAGATVLHKHDHGAMDGLTDDDHTGYVLATGARAITGTQAFSVTNAVPFTVSNSTVVTNLNADYLDGEHATAFATASHTHAFSDHGALTGLADDDHTQYTLRSQWDQNGFPNSSQVALLWTDTTRTLLVSATGTTFFTYFQSGYPYTAASMSATITDTEGLWAFYIDAQTLTAVNDPSEEDIDNVIENKAVVAYVYWDATNNDGRLFTELHGCGMSPETHHYLHDCIGASYLDGMGLSDFVADSTGALDTHAQFSIAGGEFYDEDNEIEVTTAGATDAVEVWYRSGSDWRWGTLANHKVLTHGTGRLAYDNAGTKTEVTDGNFVLYHIFATNCVTDSGASPKFISIMGQAQYNNLAAARVGADTEINDLQMGGLPLPEILPVATVIFETKDTYANSVNARVRKTAAGDNYVDWRFSSLKGGSAASDHGSLGGLADDDHTQYLRTDGTRALTGNWDAGSFEIRAQTLNLDMADGTTPMTITSSALCTQLNADFLDGSHATAFATAAHTHAFSDHGALTGLTDDDHTAYVLADGTRAITDTQEFTVTNAVPFTVSNSTVVTNLNADYLDGSHATAFATAAHTHAVSDHGSLTGLTDDDHTAYVLADGTRAITDTQEFTVTNAVPFTVSNSTVVTNLNADYLDGSHATAFATAAHTHAYAANLDDLGDVTIAGPVEGQSLYYDETVTGWVNSTFPAGVTDHGALTGLTDDDHTGYVLLAGRAGGQVVYGGANANDDLTLRTTSNATKGDVYIADDGGKVGIGTSTLTASVTIRVAVTPTLRIETTSGYVDIGAQNAGFMHMVTDRAAFYTNKHIVVNEGLVKSYDEDLQLCRSNTAGIVIGTASVGFPLPIDQTATGTCTVAGPINFTSTGTCTIAGPINATNTGTHTVAGLINGTSSFRLKAPATTTDLDYNGIYIPGTAGENLANGNLVYFKTSDTKWWLTDADAEASAGGVLLGLAIGTINANAAGNIFLWGTFCNTGWTNTLGCQFVSTTSGVFSTTKPSGSSDIVRPVGYAYHADSIMFCPSQTWVTVA